MARIGNQANLVGVSERNERVAAVVGLLNQAIMEIAIHIEPANCPLDWIDRPVSIVIEFLEMVVKQIPSVRIRYTGRTVIWAGVVASGVL